MSMHDPGDFSPLLDEQLQVGKVGDFARGAEIARKLEREFPGSHRAAFNRAWYEMREGHLLKGLECLDRGRWAKAFGSPPIATSKPIYRNESLSGKNLLLRSEGGLGDEVINVRFAKDFAKRGAKVTVSCHRSLMSVFARVEGVSSVVSTEAAAEVYHDYWVPGMSAARILEKEFSSLSGKPYLTPNKEALEKWAPMIAKKFSADGSAGKELKIGVKFFGNPKFEHEQLRKFPEQELVKALGGRKFLNLQLETTDFEIKSWEDTVAILSQLDLVITSCTSVAHVSAALGLPTWILVPILPYYIWALPGSRSPWYDSVKLYRQTEPGSWTSVFSEIKQDLLEVGK